MKFRKLLHFWRGRWRGSPCTKSLTFQYAFVWTLLPTWSGFKICNLKSLEEIQSEKTVFFSNYILFCFLILVRGSDGLPRCLFHWRTKLFSLAFKLLPIGCAYQNAIELFNRIWAGKWKHCFLAFKLLPIGFTHFTCLDLVASVADRSVKRGRNNEEVSQVRQHELPWETRARVARINSSIANSKTYFGSWFDFDFAVQGRTKRQLY